MPLLAPSLQASYGARSQRLRLPKTNAAMAEVPEPPTGAWTCEFCTFLNTKASRISCEMCRKHRKRPRDAAAAAPPPPAAADAPVNTVGGYAARLSEYANKGVTGLPEAEDSKRVLTSKLAKLADLVKNAKKIAVLTGAGISTSAGIPDFRGPKGIWTLEDEEKKRTKRRKPPRKLRDTVDEGTAGASFESAVPTPTHMALVALSRLDKLAYLATQNVDGLHVRSGFPREKLGVLHGCVFTEKCETCGREYFRDYDLGGISFQPTGRQCACGGRLLDTVLDWDDGLPDSEWLPATRHFEDADLAITLGTSLRIVPAGELPLTSKNFVIVNLQPTPYDDKAGLVIRARVDGVMAALLEALGLDVPPPPAREATVAAAAEPVAAEPEAAETVALAAEPEAVVSAPAEPAA